MIEKMHDVATSSIIKPCATVGQDPSSVGALFPCLQLMVFELVAEVDMAYILDTPILEEVDSELRMKAVRYFLRNKRLVVVAD